MQIYFETSHNLRKNVESFFEGVNRFYLIMKIKYWYF